MLLRFFLATALVAGAGCLSSSPPILLECPETELAQWEIPAGSLDRSLTPEQAYNMVLTGNLPIDGIRDRWEALAAQRQSGDEYWSYVLEKGQLVNAVGGQEGIVLIRRCRQLGFVATSVAME